jgi:hypothetical protein
MTQWYFPVFFCFKYLRLRAVKAGNPELPMGTDKEKRKTQP